ncbi:hypothetical protein [Embleya sp. NPDC020630]|uniref:hypothetical protein n=1 Tax=Embleya sp. NPDC020630 TaxID=3363979 RepID=UPI0037881F13
MATKSTPTVEVVSLDALAKQKRDALPDPVTFELFGVTFTLPPFKSLPFDVQERVAGPEDIMGIMRLTVGEEKLKEMIAAGFTVSEAELIGEEWQKRNGLEPGESQASPTS